MRVIIHSERVARKMEIKNPRLFGVIFSNRDFSIKETWGKNQFNSSFSAPLSYDIPDLFEVEYEND